MYKISIGILLEIDYILNKYFKNLFIYLFISNLIFIIFIFIILKKKKNSIN